MKLLKVVQNHFDYRLSIYSIQKSTPKSNKYYHDYRIDKLS